MQKEIQEEKLEEIQEKRLTGEVERMLVMRLSIVTNIRVMIICIRAFKV